MLLFIFKVRSILFLRSPSRVPVTVTDNMPPKGASVYGPGEHFAGYEDLTSDEEVAETPEEFQALMAAASARTRENIFQAGRALGPSPSKPSSARASGGVAGGAAGKAAAGNKAQKPKPSRRLVYDEDGLYEKQDALPASAGGEKRKRPSQAERRKKKRNTPVDPAAAAAPMPTLPVIKKEDGSEAMPQSKKLLETWPYCRGVDKQGDCAVSVGGNERTCKWHRCGHCLAKKLKQIRDARGTVMMKKSAKMVCAEHAQRERERMWGNSEIGKWNKQKDPATLQAQQQKREARKQQRAAAADAAAAAAAADDAIDNAADEDADNAMPASNAAGQMPADPTQAAPPPCGHSNAAGKMPADPPADLSREKRRTLAEVQRQRRDKERKSSEDGEGSSQRAQVPKTPTPSKKPGAHADDEAEDSESEESRETRFHNIGSGKKNMRSNVLTAEITAQAASGKPARFRNSTVVEHGLLHYHPRTGLPHRRFMPFSGDVDMADEDLPGPQKRDRKKVCEERDAKKQRREEREPSPEY